MPPLDWSIVQSMFLSLILPTFGTAAGLLGIVFWLVQSESIRSIAASIALIAAFTVGLAVQNRQGRLIPFLAVEMVAQSTTEAGAPEPPKSALGWEIETGWRSLYSAVVTAAIGEVLIEVLFRRRLRLLSAAIGTLLIASVTAVWVSPWDLTSGHPWVCAILAVVILLNQTSLRRVSQLKFGSFVPMFVAMVWGGSSATVAVFSHSARFANLAILISCALAGVGLVTAVKGLRPKTIFAGPVCFVPALMLADQQNSYSQIPVASFILIAIAPASLVILNLAKARNWFESRPIALAIWFLVPCAIAAGLAVHAEL